MTKIKTRNAIFLSSGSLVLLSIAMSRFNKNWLWLGGLVGAALVQAGMTGFCTFAYLLEKRGVTKPDYGHYEEEKLRGRQKLKIIRKIRKIRREISDYIKEIEEKGAPSVS